MLDLQRMAGVADKAVVRTLTLRRADSCVCCGSNLAVGDRAAWDSVAKTVTCLPCLNSVPVAAQPTGEVEPSLDPRALERGTAGKSVAREAARRSERHRQRQEHRIAADREWRARVKAQRPITGRLQAALTPKVRAQPVPQHVQSWVTGTPGEQKVGEALDAIAGIIALHDRRKPRTRSNIDHIAVTPAGVWVIDTKVRTGKKLEFRDRGGLLGRDERLIVGGRDETRMVGDMAWQVETVQRAGAELLSDIVVRPALCFVDVTLGLLDRRPWTVKGVAVCWRASLPDLLLRPGPLDDRRMTEIADRIISRLPPA
ncbi:hypothetical protein GHK86_02440 [Acidimicrobiaceae bacterium USS-CC1]|uniref:NERD domain-containing protein n=1 Tax=Acidiferrimicrobium australe TaxID=2664430 RepID=A0ABW9QP56_9ACTN|nr:hypothetical protein [Acidiferrimicrobium australe]